MDDHRRPAPPTTPDAVLETARALAARGLVEGTAGNVSGRVAPDRICVTPSSLSYDTMTLDDLVVVDLDGTVVSGHRSPTSERSLHLACYRRYPEVGGVIHSHPVHATMFALTREPIPAVIEEFTLYVGGEVPLCDYTMTGTDALGEVAASALADRAACLLANHGMVTVGSGPEQALHVAALVDRTARVVWGARLLGPVQEVPADVTEMFAGVYRHSRANPG